MGRLHLVRFPNASRSSYRSSRQTVKRLVLVLLILALFHQHRLYLACRDALIAKFSPTDFGLNINEAYPQPLRPDGEDSQLRDNLIANRLEWMELGEGVEGKTFMYNGTVIKTFTPERSPFRNCAPRASGERWPTEIPATLRFGGTHDNSKPTNLTSSGFLPVMAYFAASISSPIQTKWYLVTPLLERGSLSTLAKKQYKLNESYREIDIQYRPAFNRLLGSLGSLHEAGFCHDDVKPGNIFVEDNLDFVLGDLGNLRQVAHPYHTSLLWKKNNQLADCRANDVFRALKSYLTFIRNAAHDTHRFEIEFFEAEEALSRLFWWADTYKTNITAEMLRARSFIDSPRQPPTVSIDRDSALSAPPRLSLSVFSRNWGISGAVDRALKIQLGDKAVRWWALVWLFGTPVLDVCGK
jgi:serine/threonine protein kinase